MAIFDLHEAAAFLRCHPTILLKMIKEDPTLPCAKLVEDYRFIEADLEGWLRARYTAEARALLNGKSVREESESELQASSDGPKTLQQQVHELFGSRAKRSDTLRRRPRSDKSVEQVLTEIQARKAAKRRADSPTT
jgi:hypothetical protein